MEALDRSLQPTLLALAAKPGSARELSHRLLKVLKLLGAAVASDTKSQSLSSPWMQLSTAIAPRWPSAAALTTNMAISKSKERELEAFIRQNGAFLVKLVQQLLKTYLKVAPNDATTAPDDTVLAMDLAIGVMQILWRFEKIIRLGELVLENLLYQIAKKYIECSQAPSALTVFECIRERIWKHHNDLCTKLKQPDKKQCAMIVERQIDGDVSGVYSVCHLPAPESFHSASFARLVLGLLSASCVLVLPFQEKDNELTSFVATSTSWIQQLASGPGVDKKLVLSMNDRLFRGLWKCATIVETKLDPKHKSYGNPLALRFAALSFMLKCPSYSASYFVQQVYRSGMQFDRNPEKSNEANEQLLEYYRKSTELLYQQTETNGLFHQFEHEYILWLDHAGTMYSRANQRVELVWTLATAYHHTSQNYPSTNGLALWRISVALLFVFSVVNLADDSTSVKKRTALHETPIVNYLRRVNDSLCEQICRLLDSVSGNKQRIEAAQVLSCQVLKQAMRQINQETSPSQACDKADKSAMSFLLISSTRISNNLFDLIEQHPSVLSTPFIGAVQRCINMAIQTIQQWRSPSTTKIEKSAMSEHALGIEIKLRRIALTLGCRVVLSTKDSASERNEWLTCLDEQVEAMKSLAVIAKSHALVRQQLLSVLQSSIRELHVMGTKGYMQKHTSCVVVGLEAAFKLVKVSVSLSSDMNQLCQAIKAETICSLLAQCYRDDGKVHLAREYIGLAFQYGSELDDATILKLSERYVGLIVEESSALDGDCRREELKRLSSSCCGFVKSLSAVMTIRQVTSPRIDAALFCIRVLLDQASQKLLCCLRNDTLKTSFGDRKGVSDCFRLLVHLEEFVWNLMLSRINAPPANHTGIELTRQAVKTIVQRKRFYCHFFERNSATSQDSSELSRLLEPLSKALSSHDKRNPPLASAVATGLRGVIRLESLCVASAGPIAPSQFRKEDIDDVLSDIKTCLDMLQMLKDAETEEASMVVDQFLVIITLESICSCLAFFQLEALEESVRQLLQNYQSQIRSNDLPWIETFTSPMAPLLDFRVNASDDSSNAMDIDQRFHGGELDDVDKLIMQSIALRFVDTPVETSRKLKAAITILQRLREIHCKPPMDAMVYKALGVRESIMHLVCSQVYFVMGDGDAALQEAKQAFALCVRLAKQFARVYPEEPAVENLRKLPDALQRFCEVNGKQMAQSFPYFDALEHTSWDILCCTSLALDHLATLQIQRGNPHRSFGYYGDALHLVGVLGVHTFSKDLPLDLVQLLVQWGRLDQARELLSDYQADPVLSLSDSHSSLEEAVQTARQWMLLGDVCVQEGDYQQAKTHYSESQTLLSKSMEDKENQCNTSSWLQRARQESAKCDRKIVSASLGTLKALNQDEKAWLHDIMACLSRLQAFVVVDCDDPVERLLGVCELCRAWLIVNKRFTGADRVVNGYKKSWMDIRQVMNLLEAEFVTCARLGAVELEKRMRYTLGLAYLLQLELPVAQKNRQSNRPSKDQQIFCAWAVAALLLNASSIEPLLSRPKQQDASDKTRLSLAAKLDQLQLDSHDTQTAHRFSMGTLVIQVERQCHQLPSDWNIVSVMTGTTSNELVITRVESGSSPMSFVVSNVEWQRLVQEMSAILVESRMSLSGHSTDESKSWTEKQKKSWWTKRSHLDERICKLLQTLETQLRFWKCLFIKKTTPPRHQQGILYHQTQAEILEACRLRVGGEDLMASKLLKTLVDTIDFLSDEELSDGLQYVAERSNRHLSKESTQELVELMRGSSCSSSKDTDEMLSKAFTEQQQAPTDGLLSLSKEDIRRMRVNELRTQLELHGLACARTKKELCERLLEARDSALMQRLRHRDASITQDAPSGPKDSIYAFAGAFSSSILILDACLSELPWEGMELLRGISVTRMPSLQLLFHNAQELLGRDGTIPGIDRERVAFVLNPGGDLGATQQKMEPILQESASRLNWRGIVARIPQEDEIRDFLMQSDLFIYCGHGSGEKYFRREQVEKIGLLPHHHCASAFLMGCSSGKLHQEGIFGPKAAVLSYLRAASPAVVAMLWDVTDKDVDRMSVFLLQQWLLSMQGDKGSKASGPLGLALQRAREVCKLRYLNGCAAVCYGLPIGTKQPIKLL